MKEEKLVIDGVEVIVIYKAIKNIYFVIYPPHGTVRVSVPRKINPLRLHDAISRKITWIKQQIVRVKSRSEHFGAKVSQDACHYFLGERYRLNIVKHVGRAKVFQREGLNLDLYVSERSSNEERQSILDAWYRRQFKMILPSLLEKWAPRLNVPIPEFGVKKMKTRWGSCNVRAQRIWLNLELMKKSLHCIEYVVVHELVHFHERGHNARFKKWMTEMLPNWRVLRRELNGI